MVANTGLYCNHQEHILSVFGTLTDIQVQVLKYSRCLGIRLIFYYVKYPFFLYFLASSILGSFIITVINNGKDNSISKQKLINWVSLERHFILPTGGITKKLLSKCIVGSQCLLLKMLTLHKTYMLDKWIVWVCHIYYVI